MPDDMLQVAARRAYGGISRELKTELRLDESQKTRLSRLPSPTLEKMQNRKALQNRYSSFNRGDSVTVYPEQVIGIVVKPEDDMGNVLVQVKKEKKLINHRRLKLKVAASQLYPEDYDFFHHFRLGGEPESPASDGQAPYGGTGDKRRSGRGMIVSADAAHTKGIK